MGGIHHLSHEEGRLGVSIVEDAEEGSVELDVWGKGHGDGFQKHGPSSFCPFLIDGQRSLVERLEAGRATRSCVSGDSPHPGLGARRGGVPCPGWGTLWPLSLPPVLPHRCLPGPAVDTQGMLARPLSDPRGYPSLFLPVLPGKQPIASGERRFSCSLSPWLPSHLWNQILSSLGSRTLRAASMCLVPTQVLHSQTVTEP